MEEVGVERSENKKPASGYEAGSEIYQVVKHTFSRTASRVGPPPTKV
jgi:hypothetical protein